VLTPWQKPVLICGINSFIMYDHLCAPVSLSYGTSRVVAGAICSLMEATLCLGVNFSPYSQSKLPRRIAGQTSRLLVGSRSSTNMHAAAAQGEEFYFLLLIPQCVL